MTFRLGDKRTVYRRKAVGDRFARLVILARLTPVNGVTTYLCRCDCGVECTARGGDLGSGDTKSCGCLNVEVRATINLTHGAAAGGKRTPEYLAYRAMLARCYRVADARFHLYGARGIRVCDRWLKSPGDFIADMGQRPSPGHSLDRIDNDGNYEPGNCRWATRSEQQRNTRRTRLSEATVADLRARREAGATYVETCRRTRRVADDRSHGSDWRYLGAGGRAVKRSPIRRKTPMRRGEPMARTVITRKAPRRIAKRKADRPYLAFVHTLPCVVEDPTCSGRIEANHAGSKPGMGLKAPDSTCVPMCSKHHREWTDHNGMFRYTKRGERADLAATWVGQTSGRWKLACERAAAGVAA